MQILPPSDIGIRQALTILRHGGVVAHATETCYGLACDMGNVEAVAKVFAIKKRPDTQPISALFATLDQAKLYLEWNDLAEKLAAAHLPGPLTIILKLRTDSPSKLFPSPITNHQSPITIGTRVSPHPTALALVEAFGSPLSTTSANIHGQPNPYSIDDLLLQFKDAKEKPDLILDDGPLEIKEVSTVVDCSEGIMTVIRKGSLDLSS